MTDADRTELWKDLDRRVFLITQLINNSKDRLQAVERSFRENVPSVTPSCYQAVNQIHRIIQALEERMVSVNKLIAAGSNAEIARATVIAGSDLVFKNDAMHKLISEDNLPPIALDGVNNHLEELFKQAQVRKVRSSTNFF